MVKDRVSLGAQECGRQHQRNNDRESDSITWIPDHDKAPLFKIGDVFRVYGGRPTRCAGLAGKLEG
jgi:hypothetical protein